AGKLLPARAAAGQSRRNAAGFEERPGKRPAVARLRRAGDVELLRFGDEFRPDSLASLRVSRRLPVVPRRGRSFLRPRQLPTRSAAGGARQRHLALAVAARFYP